MEISSDAGRTAAEEDLIDIDIDFTEHDTNDEQMDDSEQADGQANGEDDLMYDDGDDERDEAANEENMEDYVEDLDEELDDAQREHDQQEAQGDAGDSGSTTRQSIDDNAHKTKEKDDTIALEDSLQKKDEQVAESKIEKIDPASAQEEEDLKIAHLSKHDADHGSEVLREELASQEQQQQVSAAVDDFHAASGQSCVEPAKEDLIDYNQDTDETTATPGQETNNNNAQMGPPTDDQGITGHIQEPPLLSLTWRGAIFDPFRPEGDASPLVLGYSSASDNLQSFLSACRHELQGEIDEDCELELRFEQLDLCFREVSPLSATTRVFRTHADGKQSDEDATPSLFDVNDIYVNLTFEIEDLRVALVERPTFTARWSQLNDLVASGGFLQVANPSAYGPYDEGYPGQNDEGGETEEPVVTVAASEDTATAELAPPSEDIDTHNPEQEESRALAAEGGFGAQLNHESNAQHENPVTEAEPDILNFSAEEGQDAAGHDQSHFRVEQPDGREANGVTAIADEELPEEHDVEGFEDDVFANDEQIHDDQFEDNATEEAVVSDEKATEGSKQQTPTGSYDDSANHGARDGELGPQHDEGKPLQPGNILTGESVLSEPLLDESGPDGDAHETEDSTEYFDASAGYDADGNKSSQPLEEGLDVKGPLPHDDQQDLFDDDEIHLDLPEDDEAFDNEASNNGHDAFAAAGGEGKGLDGVQTTKTTLDPASASKATTQPQAVENQIENGLPPNGVANTLSRKRSFAEQSDNAHDAGGDAKKSRAS